MSTIEVLDSTMHYTDTADAAGASGGSSSGSSSASAKGEATAVVFLHGNPTSGYLWRNVVPHVAEHARALAPDLIGMGKSGKPDIAYDFIDHARYLDAWFEAVGLDQVVLVGHDWGGVLAMDWAARHPDRIRGLVLLETFVMPATLENMPERAQERFAAFLTPGVGENLVLEQNIFIETAFKGGVLNPLSDEEQAPYRAPYPTPESRRPLLAWPRTLTRGDEKTPFTVRQEAYQAWLSESTQIPKLLLVFEGSQTLMVSPEVAERAKSRFASLEVLNLGMAGHHAPEDLPHEIGSAVSDWLKEVKLA